MLAVRAPSGEWQPIYAAESGPISACGLAAGGTDVYCAYTYDGNSHVAVCDLQTARVIESIPLPRVRDAHGLVLDGDSVIVASTGSDEIVRVQLADGRCDVLWRASSADADTHHLSGLLMHEGRLLCTAFGRRIGPSWADAVDGYLYDLSRGTYLARGIYQPHSPALYDGRLYFCESPRGAVRSLEGDVQYVEGYARGLAFADDGSYAAGCSIARRAQDIPGATYRNPADTGAPAGRCAVYFGTLGGTLADCECSRERLDDLGAEIFDVLTVG